MCHAELWGVSPLRGHQGLQANDKEGEGCAAAARPLCRGLRWVSTVGSSPPASKGHLTPHPHLRPHSTCRRTLRVAGPGHAEPCLHADEGQNTVAVSETDYRLFITFHLQNFRNGTETHTLALYGTSAVPL